MKSLDHAHEQALVERARRADMEAFGRIVDAYQARLMGFIKRMVGNSEEAADLTQEVFIRAFQNFHRFDGRCSLRTWLFRIAHNLVIDRSRKAGRAPAMQSLSVEEGVEMEVLEVADERWSPDRLMLDDELLAVVESAIQTMSEKLRSVLLLSDREDMAQDEIAEALGLPLGTVKSRLFLARAHLQQCVRSYLEETRG